MKTPPPPKDRRSRKGLKKIIPALIFILAGLAAIIICSFLAARESGEFLRRLDREETARLAECSAKISAWRESSEKQASSVLESESVQAFLAASAAGLTDGGARPERPRAFLRREAERWGWLEARLVSPEGESLLGGAFSAPAEEGLSGLVKKAMASGRPALGPIHFTGQSASLYMAAPAFSPDGAPLGALLAAIAMDKPLQSFLSHSDGGLFRAAIVSPDKGIPYAVTFQGGALMMEPAAGLKRAEDLPFERRAGLFGGGLVWSKAVTLKGLDWLCAAEAPAREAEALMLSRKIKIFSAGGLAALAAALLARIIWDRAAGRKSGEIRGLRKIINYQKALLNSLYAAFPAGITLIDKAGRALMSNPAFNKICGERAEPGALLREIFPEPAAQKLMEDLKQALEAGMPAHDEDWLNIGDERRLFRISFYPLPLENGHDKAGGGCAAVFQDITEFRRKALAEKSRLEKERQKQDALITAFVSAIESVDPSLSGRSGKMARVAELLSNELMLAPEEAETLEQASWLSQAGALYVPRGLLVKKEPLAPEELKLVRQAPEHAASIFRGFDFDLPVRETLVQMGERMDGSGPKGLKGPELTLAGRALAVINAFAAMTSPRAWRGGRGMSVQEALSSLRSDPGFDQEIVEALHKIPLDQLEKISAQSQGKPSPLSDAGA